MQFLEKLWEMRKNIKILNLSQQKKKELFSMRTKLSHYKFFTENRLSTEMRKTQIRMNNLVYFDLSKTVKCEFWYDYVKPKYGEKAKLCYINTNIIGSIKT